MPIWNDVPQRLASVIGRIRRERNERSGAKIEFADVEAVHDKKNYMIRGVPVPTTGDVQLRAGETVPVAFKDGEPVAILAHSARRSQFPQIPPSGARGIIEQLIVGSVGGVRDIYFRNDSVLRSLNVRALTGVNYVQVFWGANDNVFYARRQGVPEIFDVFKLARSLHTVTPENTVPRVTLLRTDNLYDGTVLLANVIINYSSGVTPPVQNFAVVNATPFVLGGVTPATLPGSAIGALSVNLVDTFLDAKNEMYGIWRLSIQLTVSNAANIVMPANWDYVIVANHTKKTRTFDSFSDPGIINGPIGGIVTRVFNTMDMSTIPTSGAGPTTTSIEYFPQFTGSGLLIRNSLIDTILIDALYRQRTNSSGSPDRKKVAAFMHPSGRFPLNTIFPLATNQLAGTNGFRLLDGVERSDRLESEFHAIYRAFESPSNTLPKLVAFSTSEIKEIDTSLSHFNTVGLILIPTDTLYTLGDDNEDRDRFFVVGWQSRTGPLTLNTAGTLTEKTVLQNHKKLVGEFRTFNQFVLDELIVTIDQFQVNGTAFHVVPAGVQTSLI